MKTKKISEFFKKYIKPKKDFTDRISVSLYDIQITVERKINIDIPHEVTVVLPRVELRSETIDNRKSFELILNSITVVHSPQHSMSSNYKSLFTK